MCCMTASAPWLLDMICKGMGTASFLRCMHTCTATYTGGGAWAERGCWRGQRAQGAPGLLTGTHAHAQHSV